MRSAITLVLFWILIGSFIWAVFDGAHAFGRATHWRRAVTASAMMIVWWPPAAVLWLRGAVAHLVDMWGERRQ